AITLGRPKRVLLAIGGSGRRSHLHLHQPLRGKADHLAQKISIRRLLHEGSQVHHVVGHRWSFRNGVGVATRPYRKAPMTTDMPLARYSAVNGALTSGFVIAELHHLTGRDRRHRSVVLVSAKQPHEADIPITYKHVFPNSHSLTPEARRSNNLVSIITRTKNRPALLVRAVYSVLAQTH